MTQAEGALGDAVELLQQVREGARRLRRPSYDDISSGSRRWPGRSATRCAQLLVVANRGDGAGGYVLPARARARRRSSTPGACATTARRAQTTPPPGLPMTMDGAAVWLSAPSGNGVFETRAAVAAGSAWIDAGRVVDPSAVTGVDRIAFKVTGGVGGTYSVLEYGSPTAAVDVPYVDAGDRVRRPLGDGQGRTRRGRRVRHRAIEPTLSVFDTLDRLAGQLDTPMRSSGERSGTPATACATSMPCSAASRRCAPRQATRSGASIPRPADSSKPGTRRTQNARRPRDLDLVSALSDLQTQQTAYQTALQAYASVATFVAVRLHPDPDPRRPAACGYHRPRP